MTDLCLYCGGPDTHIHHVSKPTGDTPKPNAQVEDAVAKWAADAGHGSIESLVADAVAQAVKERDNWRNDFQEACRQRDEQAEEITRLTKGWQDEARMRVKRDEEIARLHEEKQNLIDVEAMHVEEIVRLRAERDQQGTNSWRSCGHIAWGTCSTCYTDLVARLAEKALRQERD